MNFGNNIIAKATSISCFWNSQVNLDSQFEERRESAEPTKVSMKRKAPVVMLNAHRPIFSTHQGRRPQGDAAVLGTLAFPSPRTRLPTRHSPRHLARAFLDRDDDPFVS